MEIETSTLLTIFVLICLAFIWIRVRELKKKIAGLQRVHVSWFGAGFIAFIISAILSLIFTIEEILSKRDNLSKFFYFIPVIIFINMVMKELIFLGERGFVFDFSIIKWEDITSWQIIEKKASYKLKLQYLKENSTKNKKIHIPASKLSEINNILVERIGQKRSTENSASKN